MDILNKVMQGKKETLCIYIDRLTKVAVVMEGSLESLKCWTFEKDLTLDFAFWGKMIPTT